MISTEMKRQSADLHQFHHVRMVIVLKWFGVAAFIFVVLLGLLRLAGNTLATIADQLRGVDWGIMFNFGIFAIMIAAAIAIIMKGRQRVRAG